MARVLRSKPVLVIGTGALVRRMLNTAQMRRKRRRSMKGRIFGLILASAAGGAVKYFGDSVSGQRRREKLKRIMGKAEQGPEWSGTDQNAQKNLHLQDSTPSQT